MVLLRPLHSLVDLRMDFHIVQFFLTRKCDEAEVTSEARTTSF